MFKETIRIILCGICCAVVKIYATGSPFKSRILTASVNLGEIQPESVCVEIYHGTMNNVGEIEPASRVEMDHAGATDDVSVHQYTATVRCDRAGRQGLAIRVLPKHPALISEFVPGYVIWG